MISASKQNKTGKRLKNKDAWSACAFGHTQLSYYMQFSRDRLAHGSNTEWNQPLTFDRQ